MTTGIACVVAAVLVALAALHVAWGLGVTWPAQDEASLVDMVIGWTATRGMPSLFMCALVALALLVPTGAALIVSGVMPNFFPRFLSWAPMVALWGSVLVFAARGTATYVSPIFNYAREAHFFALNRTLYSPLCLVLAAGLAFVGVAHAVRGAAQ